MFSRYFQGFPDFSAFFWAYYQMAHSLQKGPPAAGDQRWLAGKIIGY
jgi:hypothetical protein